jgi:translation initiation factor 1A
MNKKKEEQLKQEQQEYLLTRTRLPRGREVFGILEQRLGASRLRVKCLDGKSRVCRIPGRLKKKLWVREGDVVIVEPWEFGGNEKGDVIYKYNPTQVGYLKNKGYLKHIEDFEEF